MVIKWTDYSVILMNITSFLIIPVAFHPWLFSVGLIWSNTCFDCFVLWKELTVKDSLTTKSFFQLVFIQIKQRWVFLGVYVLHLVHFACSTNIYVWKFCQFFIAHHKLFQKLVIFVTQRIVYENVCSVIF